MLQELVEFLKKLIDARTAWLTSPEDIVKAKQDLYTYADKATESLKKPSLNVDLWKQDAIQKLELLRECRDLAFIRMSPRAVLGLSAVVPASIPEDYKKYWYSILQYKYPYVGDQQ